MVSWSGRCHVQFWGVRHQLRTEIIRCKALAGPAEHPRVQSDPEMNSASLQVFLTAVVTLSVSVPGIHGYADQSLKQRYRISVHVEPGESSRANAPAGVEIDFGDLFQQEQISERVDQNSIRVVRVDRRSGTPIRYNDAQLACPHQTTGDFFNRQHGLIWWRMKDANATDFQIYFDTIENGPHAPPERLGLIGIGDHFHYNDGAPSFANAVALHSQFWHVDWDGDGLRDLIGFAYRPYEYGPDRPKFPGVDDPAWWRKVQPALGNAVYFHKNIGGKNKPLFAPRQRVLAADGTYLRSDLLPQNMFPADWDEDGDLDFFGIGRGNALLVWENTGQRDPNGLWMLKTARTEGILDQTSKFRDEFPAMVDRPSRFSYRGIRRIDWDGDGDWDLLTALRRVNRLWPVDPKQGVIPYGTGLMVFEVLENTAGPDAKPVYAKPFVIREERGLPINAFSVATGCAEYVDWDRDGDHDLLYHDLTNRPLEGGRLMFAENRGSREKPLFSMPIPILPVHDSPYVVDWSGDRIPDLIAGSEFFENVNKTPFEDRASPRTRAGSRRSLDSNYPQLVSRGFAQQVNPPMVSYFGVSVDWDGDGVLDMIRGDQSHVLFFRNRGTLLDPVFERGVQLQSAGKPIYLPNWLDQTTDLSSHFGPQGPSEPNHGWVNPAVGDWDGDGDLDLFLTGQRWQTAFFENIGSRTKPKLARGREVVVDGNRYEFSWRSKVSLGDIDGDGTMELVVTSNEDRVFYVYEQQPAADSVVVNLKRGQPLKLKNGDPIKGWYGGQNNNGDNHSLLVDWDNDGDLDLINGSLFAVWYYENVGSKTQPEFHGRGRFSAGGEPLHTFFHAGSIDAADWNGDGRLDLVLSAECPSDSPHGAVLHYFERSFLEDDLPRALLGSLERVSP